MATPARTASANQQASPSTSQPAETPLLIAGSWSGRDPSSIQFGGDGGSDVRACRWSTWRSTEALGYCTGAYNNCVPTCAQGTSANIQVQVTLTTPADGHWTRMVFTDSAGSNVWTYPSYWAVGADNSNGG